MNRNMAAETRGKTEDKSSGLIKIQPIGLGSGGKKEDAKGGFKKGGFKSAFGKVEGGNVVVKKEPGVEDGESEVGAGGGKGMAAAEPEESDTEDEGYECYDPRRPTGCKSGCRGRG